MSKAQTAPSGEVVTGFCSPELAQQLQAFLGEDFTISSLSRHLRQRAPFKESRGVLHTFSDDDPEVFAAQNATFKGMRFTPRCEVDINDHEIADYRILPPPKGEKDERVAVRISPNALMSVYKPVRAIYDTKAPASKPKHSAHPSKSHATSGIRQVDDVRGHLIDLVQQKEPEAIDPAQAKARDEALNMSYTGVYSSIIARFAVERHLFRNIEELSEEEILKRQTLISDIYEPLFGRDESSLEIRLNRLAMSVGGAVMFRYLGEAMSYRFRTNLEDIGGYLKVFALGISGTKQCDENPVSFAMAHLLSPAETTAFMNAWFGRANLKQ